MSLIKLNGKGIRDLEKNVLHEEITKSEKNKEWLKYHSIVPKLWDRPRLHCYAYSLYGDEKYLTYLRYSIMSLRMVHNDAKIIVFAEEKLWAKAREELKHLIFEHDIIFVKGVGACYKQVLACHYILKDYKHCTILDADLFFLSKKNDSFRQYLNIVKDLINKNPKSFVWAFGRKETPNVNDTVMYKRGREETLWPHTYIWDMEEEMDMDIVELLEKETLWNISYIFSFSPKQLQSDKYKAWAMWTMFNNNMCDETCWWLWSKKYNWKAFYWNNVNKNLSIDSKTHEGKEVHLFQPMFTDELEKKIHRRYQTFMAILEIENKYKEFIHERLQHEQI